VPFPIRYRSGSTQAHPSCVLDVVSIWIDPNAPFPSWYRSGSTQSPKRALPDLVSIWIGSNAPFPIRYRSGSTQTRPSRLGIDLDRPKRSLPDLVSPSRRRWPAGSVGGSSCAVEPRIAAQCQPQPPQCHSSARARTARRFPVAIRGLSPQVIFKTGLKMWLDLAVISFHTVSLFSGKYLPNTNFADWVYQHSKTRPWYTDHVFGKRSHFLRGICRSYHTPHALCSARTEIGESRTGHDFVFGMPE
jgi:hypothetical protein